MNPEIQKYRIRKSILNFGFTSIVLFFFNWNLPAQDSTHLKVNGLQKSVTIHTDRWGVAHIQAQTEQDLFFAQGYQAAKDRLFQLEIFRRQATGTVAEILGERELDRDIGSRLFKFRGNLSVEFKHYHPRGDQIIKSFVQGINAYIKRVLEHKEQLPPEFKLLDIIPGYWTPEVVISRHQGLLANVQTELQTARWVSQIGEQRVINLMNYHPHIPSLSLDTIFNKASLNEDILKWYDAFRKPIAFQHEDLLHSSLNLNLNFNLNLNSPMDGSNNWVISGSKTQSGYPIMANDPHRAITVPSLRYIVHLQAPGWNVIGGGEPVLPGVSIGHNDYGAWGLTIFQTDMEDLYVYPYDVKRNSYKRNGQWLAFKQIKDTIYIKDQSPVKITHRYTVQGPVVFMDTLRKLVYAVRCAWLESGCAPYLASLRMNQARSWDAFKQACSYAYVPAENMVWADRQGNIGWQTVGLAPIRPNHSGLVPVRSETKNDWSGYLPVLQRPGAFNPKSGYIATANDNLTPPNYPHMNSIGYIWADPYRGQRIREILQQNRSCTISNMQSLQTDYISLPSRQLTPFILAIDLKDSYYKNFQDKLIGWNHDLNARSPEAALFVLTENAIEGKLLHLLLPENMDQFKGNDINAKSLSTQLVLKMVISPDDRLGPQPVKKRNEIIFEAFKESVDQLVAAFGVDMARWRYGNERLKHVKITHPFSLSLNDMDRKKFDTGWMPRGGNSNTVNSTGDGNNQTHGASFRIIVDCADWDQTVATNTPGQNGNPSSTHYSDLFPLWAKDQYFPLYYSKKKIAAVTEKILMLTRD